MPKAGAITPARRAELWTRSAGHCEACGYSMTRAEMQAHHRKMKSQGGQNDLMNLLAVHPRCHNMSQRSIHANPKRSYELGHLVRSTGDPALILAVVYPHMNAEPWKDSA